MQSNEFDNLHKAYQQVLKIAELKGSLEERKRILNIMDISINYAKRTPEETLAVIMRYISTEGNAEVMRDIERLENERLD